MQHQTRLPIDDCDRARHFDAVFIDWIGGEEVWQMLIAHCRGMSYRQIAEMYNTPRTSVHSWITAAKVKLRRVGFNVESLNAEVTA